MGAPQTDTKTKPVRRSTKLQLRDLAMDAIADSDRNFDEACRLLDEAIGNNGALIREVCEDRVRERIARYIRTLMTSLQGVVEVAPHTRKKPQTNGSDATPTAKPTAQSKANRAAHDQAATNLMGTYLVRGMPLKDCSRAVLFAEGFVNDVNGRFLKSLASQLPTDDATVGDNMVEAEVAQAMDMARQRAKEAS